MAPWLIEYVLQHLQPPIDDGQGGLASPTPPATFSVRLIQIVGRGGDWWTHAVPGNMCHCWLIVSDGQYSIQAELTREAMEGILKEVGSTHTPSFHNYTRGQCALIRNFSFKIVPRNDNNFPILRLIVGSIEAKPGFRLPGLQQQRTLQPVGDNVDVRFAMQTWEAQQREMQRRLQEAAALGEAAARPAKRQRTTPLGDAVKTVARHPHAYQEILALAEQELPAIDDTEEVKDDNEEEDRPQTQDSYQPETQPPTQLFDPQAENYNQLGTPASSQSRHFIQNVLMSQEEEEEQPYHPQSQKSPSTPSQNARLQDFQTPPTRSARQQRRQQHGSTWDYIKEQLFDENTKVIICQPEKKTYNPLFSPPPRTGAYFKKHGLARWLQHNMVKKENRVGKGSRTNH